MVVEYKRKSIRLKDYNYSSAGAYFVTICTQNKENLFGAIVKGAMHLNEFGYILQESWTWLPKQYEYLELDEWVIMPNHFHGILKINELDRKHIKSLGSLVGAFKTVAAKRINELRNMPGGVVWQRNYYEHIIRNDNDCNRIRQYVLNNVLKWESDKYYKL